uniref:cAMP-dependent protein kinase inhibitor alpha n=1 Tax=Oryzias sinensis TaxID=183150 RepID=A0A8C7WXL2_9TELE
KKTDLHILITMTDVEVSFEDFIASRRSGRRNAIHEIPTEKLQGSMDLSQRLAQLRISKKEGDSESNQDSSAKEEEAQAEGS